MKGSPFSLLLSFYFAPVELSTVRVRLVLGRTAHGIQCTDVRRGVAVGERPRAARPRENKKHDDAPPLRPAPSCAHFLRTSWQVSVSRRLPHTPITLSIPSLFVTHFSLSFLALVQQKQTNNRCFRPKRTKASTSLRTRTTTGIET